MFIQPISGRFSAGLVVTSLLFLATPLRTQPPEATPSRVQTEIVQIRAENAAIRDELRKLEACQLQRLCHGSPVRVSDGATNRVDAAPIL
jgi:hypothetical protein